MNKLVLPGTIWLASDLHLGPQAPATQEAFLAFLEAAGAEADALVLPGDIFDAWIGDDVIRAAPAWLAQALAGLKAAGARTQLWIGHGNRDFLMGQELADAIGARLLPDPVTLETAFGAVLLSHGDAYCTDDAAYQQFRGMVRDARWQSAFLSKTIPERLAIAQQARGESVSANQSKTSEIMDVNAQAVAQAFSEAGVGLMVHGHTHRPGRHVEMIDGRRRERWVLPDWDLDHAASPRGGWLVIDRDGPQVFEIGTDD